MSERNHGWTVVTGANGLVGKAVCKQMVANQTQVLALVRPGDRRRPVDGVTYQEVDLASPVGATLDLPKPMHERIRENTDVDCGVLLTVTIGQKGANFSVLSTKGSLWHGSEDSPKCIAHYKPTRDFRTKRTQLACISSPNDTSYSNFNCSPYSLFALEANSLVPASEINSIAAVPPLRHGPPYSSYQPPV